MKILMNGIYRGGNCPPYYRELKYLGNEIKVVDLSYFTENYAIDYGLFDKGDLIVPNYSRITQKKYWTYRKFGFPSKMNVFVSFAKKIISDFNPDLIINHRISNEAFFMLKTNFEPQVSLVYGSEIGGSKLYSTIVEYIFRKSNLILTTSDEEVETIRKAYNFDNKKVKCIDWGLFNCDEIKAKQKKVNIEELRSKFNVKHEQFLISDLRSLRNSNVTNAIILSIAEIRKMDLNVVLMLVQGFLGKDSIVKEAMELINKNNLQSNVRIIEGAISEEEKLHLLIASDAMTSLLPNDSLGTIILEGGLTKNLLILTDLPQYRRIFNDDAIYISDNNPEVISEKLAEYIRKKAVHNLDNIYRTIDTRYNSHNCFKIINNEFKELIKKEIV